MKSLFLSLALLVSAPVLAEDAGTPLKASEAKKANSIQLNGGRVIPMDYVAAGPDDSVASVRAIYEERFVNLPGSSLSAFKPRTIKSSLTAKDVAKLP
jgi:hypothetical protein